MELSRPLTFARVLRRCYLKIKSASPNERRPRNNLPFRRRKPYEFCRPPSTQNRARTTSLVVSLSSVGDAPQSTSLHGRAASALRRFGELPSVRKTGLHAVSHRHRARLAPDWPRSQYLHGSVQVRRSTFLRNPGKAADSTGPAHEEGARTTGPHYLSIDRAEAAERRGSRRSSVHAAGCRRQRTQR